MFAVEDINHRNCPYTSLLFHHGHLLNKYPPHPQTYIHFNLIDLYDLLFICVTIINMINRIEHFNSTTEWIDVYSVPSNKI